MRHFKSVKNITYVRFNKKKITYVIMLAFITNEC